MNIKQFDVCFNYILRQARRHSQSPEEEAPASWRRGPRRRLDARAAPKHRDCPAARTVQPTCLHHPQVYVVHPDGHDALVEVEQHADAATRLSRGLLALQTVAAFVHALKTVLAKSRRRWTSSTPCG